MRLLSLLTIFILFQFVAVSQVEYRDILLQNTIYNTAPEEVKRSKAFIREWVFFEERAYPNNYIPEGTYQKAVSERNLLRSNKNLLTEKIIWNSIGPTPGYYFSYGNISSRVVTGTYHPENPDIIYIGPANGGVWKSTDSGLSWTPLSDDQPSLSMGSIVLDPANPDIIYAGTGEATYSGASYYGAGLLKSLDGGSTWLHITNGLPSQTYFSRLVIRPGHSNELLAALGNSGLYRSSNSGLNWYQLVSGRCDDVIFTPSGDTAFAVGSGVGFRRSTNGGLTFSTFGANLPSGTRTHFDLCKQYPHIMYAAVYSSSTVKAYKSTNAGINWLQIAPTQDFNGGQAWYDLYCKVHPKNPDVVFIGIIDIYRSTDGGTNFTNITYGYSGGNVHVDQHYLFFHPSNDNTIIVCNDGGVNHSTNLGNSFSNLNSNLTLTQFYRITASPFNARRILGGTQDNGTQETKGALNWNAPFGGDGGEVCFNPFDSLFIIGETQNGGLRRTTNGGTSWSSSTSGINTSENVAWVAPIIAHPSINGTFYVARQKVYKSTNNGGTWTAISADVNGTTAVREMAISKSNPDVMYATSSSKVFRSSNGGTSWINVTVGLPSKTVSSVYIHPDSSNITFVTFLGFGGAKVYKTTNNGTSWFSISSDLPDTPVTDFLIYPDNPAKVDFVATDVGVFITTNGGTNWTEIYQGLPNTVIKHLDYSPLSKKLRAGTHGRGVYEAVIDFGTVTANFVTQAGWNLVSVPLQSSYMIKDSLFTNSTSSAYVYNNGYFISDTLKVGQGYWLKFSSPQIQSISGQSFNELVIPVNQGWNIIGGLNDTISAGAISSLPPKIIASSFYGYNGAYNISSTLEPGNGYWIKTSSSGDLIITNSSNKNYIDVASKIQLFDKIIVKDKAGKEFNLYLTGTDENLDIYELPPITHDGFSDVRFSSGRFVENLKNNLVVQFKNLEFPITIYYHSLTVHNLGLEFKYSGGIKKDILRSNHLQIINHIIGDKLILKVFK